MTTQLPSTRGLLAAGLPVTLAATAAVAVILTVYFWLPPPSGDDPPWVILFFIVLVSLLYVVVAIWSVFRIHTSAHPLRTGVTALAVMVTAVVVIFALAYLALSKDNPDNFNVALDKVSALYFTMTILTTVGFGDIHAQTHPAMIAVMLQMVVSLTLVTTLGRIVVEASRSATKRRYDEANASSPP